jgi:hypothetical protein
LHIRNLPRLRRPTACVTGFLALLLGSPIASAEQLHVAADGSEAFTQIQAAVNYASSSDVIWVAAGSYAAVTINGKALLIVGAGAETVSAASLTIESVPQGLVGVASLRVLGATLVTDNQATVLLCDDEGGELTLRNCVSAYVQSWRGRRGSSDSVQTAWLTNCRFEGPAGKNAVPGLLPGTWITLPTPGGTAFEARTSWLRVAGTEFVGGAGGLGSCLPLPGLLPGASGGAGLADVLGNCSFFVAQSSFTGGAGGEGGPLCQAAAAGIGLLLQPGTKLEWDESAAPLYPLAVLTPSLLGQKTTILISGVPGDKIMLIISNLPGAQDVPNVVGFPLGAGIAPAAHLNLWWLTRTIGVDGTLEWMHKIPDAPELAGTPTFLQALLVPGPTSAPHPATLTGTSVSIILP